MKTKWKLDRKPKKGLKTVAFVLFNMEKTELKICIPKNGPASFTCFVPQEQIYCKADFLSLWSYDFKATIYGFADSETVSSDHFRSTTSEIVVTLASQSAKAQQHDTHINADSTTKQKEIVKLLYFLLVRYIKSRF